MNNNNYFILLEKNQHSYPYIGLISGYFKSHKGNFLLDHTLSINIIKESEVASFVNIDRNSLTISRQGTINTSGSTTIEFVDFSLKFDVINYQSDSGIIGVLGAQFLDQVFETNYFHKVALEYEKSNSEIEYSIGKRLRRRIFQVLRNSCFRKFF